MEKQLILQEKGFTNNQVNKTINSEKKRDILIKNKARVPSLLLKSTVALFPARCKFSN